MKQVHEKVHTNSHSSSHHRSHHGSHSGSHRSSHKSFRKKMPYFFKRIVESFFYEILISAMAAKFVDWGIIPETFSSIIKLLVICIAIIAVPTWIALADYLLAVRRIKVYLRVNLLVYAIMAAVVLFFAYFDLEPFLTYLFFPYKILYWAGFDKVFSAAVVSILNFVMVFLMPLVFSEHLRHQI